MRYIDAAHCILCVARGMAVAEGDAVSISFGRAGFLGEIAQRWISAAFSYRFSE